MAINGNPLDITKKHLNTYLNLNLNLMTVVLERLRVLIRLENFYYLSLLFCLGGLMPKFELVNGYQKSLKLLLLDKDLLWF